MELWNTEMTAVNVLNVIVMNHATTLNVLYLEQNAQLKLNVSLMVLVFDTGESIENRNGTAPCTELFIPRKIMLSPYA